MYKKTKKLGSGTYGSVYAATDLKGNLVAIKRVYVNKTSKINGIMGLKEIDISLKLKNHKHLNGLINVCVNPFSTTVSPVKDCRDDKYYLVFPYASGCLYDHKMRKKVGRLSIRKKIRMFYQLLLALYHIHSQGIIHRDIKTNNILYNKNKDNIDVILSDYGFCEYGNCVDIKSTQISLSYYKPPEILAKNNMYDYKVDIWSMACVFNEIMTGGVDMFRISSEILSKNDEDAKDREVIDDIMYKFGSPTDEDMNDICGKSGLLYTKKESGYVIDKLITSSASK